MNELEFQGARLLSALGRGIRVQLVGLLRQRDMSVSEIMAALGRSQSVVSHHLGVLRAHDVVRFRVQGRLVIYSLKDRSVLKITDEACRFARRAAGKTQRPERT